jgi:hypothetical protein
MTPLPSCPPSSQDPSSLHVTQSIQIITTIAAAEERPAPPNLLPNLCTLYLFCPTIWLPPSPLNTPAKATKAATAEAVGTMYDRDAMKILLHFYNVTWMSACPPRASSVFQKMLRCYLRRTRGL